MLVARDRCDLRKVRGEPQYVEYTEGDGDQIDAADDHGTLFLAMVTTATAFRPLYELGHDDQPNPFIEANRVCTDPIRIADDVLHKDGEYHDQD